MYYIFNLASSRSRSSEGAYNLRFAPTDTQTHKMTQEIVDEEAQAPVCTLELNLIVAATRDGHGIGYNGQLPWSLRKDMDYFRRVTMDFGRDAACEPENVVIMGRRTWDSIPVKYRPLKGRLNIVLSRSLSFLQSLAKQHQENVWGFTSLESCLSALSTRREGLPPFSQVFLIGGATLYTEAFPSVSRVFLTTVDLLVSPSGVDSIQTDTTLPVLSRLPLEFTPVPKEVSSQLPFYGHFEEGKYSLDFSVFERSGPSQQ